MSFSALLRLYCLCLLLGLCACDKKDSEGIRSVSEYAPMKVGSYWIYQYYQVDDNGNEVSGGTWQPPTVLDSVYVEKDTMVGNNRYYKVIDESLPQELWLMRDSSNYLVDQTGRIRLAPADFKHVFYETQREAFFISPDSVFIVQQRMADWDKVIGTPAGSFTTISMDEIYTFIPFAHDQRGKSERRIHNRYAKGVGMVSQTMPFYTSNPYYLERRLLRYRLN